MNITPPQIDTLKELINIGVGHAAGVLNEMVNSHIKLESPQIRLVNLDELEQAMEEFGTERLAAVSIAFKGAFSGTSAIMLRSDCAAKMVALLTGEKIDSPGLDVVRTGTLKEIGNIIINGVMGSLVNVLKQKLRFSLPNFYEETVNEMVLDKFMAANGVVLVAQTRLFVEEYQIETSVIIIFESETFEILLKSIDTSIEQYT